MDRTIKLIVVLIGLCHARPNVVILFADDMGYGDMSNSGHPTIMTPNLDKLAAEGMKFTQWYSGFHVCSPSRASMLTGRLPVRVGIAGSWMGGVFSNDAIGGLPANETTFAEILRKQGYATKAIGKWHLGQRPQFLPTAHGFDEYYGIPYSVDMGDSPWKGLPRNNGGFSTPLLHNTTIIEQPANYDLLSSRYTQEARTFITKNAASKKPFLLYLPLNHVHVPDFVAPENCNKSRRGLYGDALEEMDGVIGEVMKTLKSSGVDDNTIVFFTSDNGPWLVYRTRAGSAGLLKDGKTTTWEGGVREPAIVRWPGKIPAGTVTSAIAATYDIFPTIVKLAGGSIPTDRVIDGQDLSDILFNGGQSKHKCIFVYKGTPGAGCPRDHPNCPGLWAVRCGAYKVHWVTNTHTNHTPVFHDPPLMYNVEVDPGEQLPLKTNSKTYQYNLKIIAQAKAAHEKTVKPVPNQIMMGGNFKYAQCCDPNSENKYPSYPKCTCDVNVWKSEEVCNTDIIGDLTISDDDFRRMDWESESHRYDLGQKYWDPTYDGYLYK